MLTLLVSEQETFNTELKATTIFGKSELIMRALQNQSINGKKLCICNIPIKMHKCKLYNTPTRIFQIKLFLFPFFFKEYINDYNAFYFVYYLRSTIVD